MASQTADMISGMVNDFYFWMHVAKTDDGCWEWTGSKWSQGYGRFWDKDRKQRRSAHLLAYELTVGPVPEGLQLDHLCRNKGCVNPDHLEPVTPGENQRRGYLAGRAKPGSPKGTRQGGAWTMLAKTHCPHGHPYSGENLIVDRKGHRKCRACIKVANAKQWAKSQARKRGG